MSQVQLARVWFAVGCILLFYALNTWLVVQGGNTLFDINLIHSGPTPAALIGICVCAVLLIVVSGIGLLYARRSPPGWCNRIPMGWLDKVQNDAPEVRVIKGALLAVFSLLPLAGMVHFWRVVIGAPVMKTDGSKQLLGGIWDWNGLTTMNDPARICSEFNPSLESPCLANATVMPGLEPTLFAVLTGVATLLVFLHWRAVFLASPRQTNALRPSAS